MKTNQINKALLGTIMMSALVSTKSNAQSQTNSTPIRTSLMFACCPSSCTTCCYGDCKTCPSGEEEKERYNNKKSKSLYHKV